MRTFFSLTTRRNIFFNFLLSTFCSWDEQKKIEKKTESDQGSARCKLEKEN